jgi:autotransporter-associated beta strand protein
MKLRVIPEILASLSVRILAAVTSLGLAGVLHATGPTFDWSHVHGYAHVANSQALFTDLQIQWLAQNNDIVTINPNHNVVLNGTVEIPFATDAARLRSVNPACKVLFYLNTSIAYTTESTNVSNTFGNPTWVSSHPDWVLMDSNNQPILGPGNAYRFNLSNTNLQTWWVNIASNMCAIGGADGVFVDALFQVDQATAAGGAAAQTAGAVAMLSKLRTAVGTNKFLLGNIIRRGSSETPPYMPYLDGGMAEHFLSISSDTPSDYIADIADVKYWGQQGKVVVAKGWPGFSFLDAFAQTNSQSLLYSVAKTNIFFPLAAYLCGAQTNSYFSYSWGYSFINTTNDSGWFSYYQDLFRRLGAPLSNYVQTGGIFTRQFANASISVNVSNQTGQISWSSPLVEIITPTNGTSGILNSSQSLPVTVSAQDSSGIQRVNYFVNGALVASNSVAPFSVIVTNPPPAGFALVAQAVNSNGVDSTSATVNLTIQSPTTWTWDAGAGSIANINNPANWAGDTNPLFDGTVVPVFGTAGSVTTQNKPGGAPFSGIIFNRDANFSITYVTTQTSNLVVGAYGILASAPGSTVRSYLITDDITLTADQPWTTANSNSTLTVDGLNSAGSIGSGRTNPFVDLSSYTLTLNPAANSTITITNSTIQGTGSLIVAGTGTAVLAASNTLTGQILVQSGKLTLLGAGSLNAATKFDVSSGAQLDVSLAAFSLKTGQTLTGGGTVAGPVTVMSNAIFNPGTGSFGILTLTSNLTLQGSVQIRVSVDGGTTNNNRVTGANMINYGGSLVVSNIGLTALTAGKSFNLFSATSATGNFTNIGPSPGPFLKWAFNPTNGSLFVVALPGPIFAGPSLVGTNLILSGSNGVSGVGFSLMSATNLSLPRNQWSLVKTGTFDSFGNFGVTNSINRAEPARFYFLSVP